MARRKKHLHRRYIDNRRRKYERKLYNLFDGLVVYTLCTMIAIVLFLVVIVGD